MLSVLAQMLRAVHVGETLGSPIVDNVFPAENGSLVQAQSGTEVVPVDLKDLGHSILPESWTRTMEEQVVAGIVVAVAVVVPQMEQKRVRASPIFVLGLQCQPPLERTCSFVVSGTEDCCDLDIAPGLRH